MLLKYYDIFDVNIFYINLVLDIVVESLFVFCLFFLFNRLFVKKEIKTIDTARGKVTNLITWGVFFLLLSIAHLIKIYVSIVTLSGPMDTNLENLLTKVGTLLIFFSFIAKILFVENVINSQKLYKGYWFSIVFALVIAIIFFIDIESIEEIGPIQSLFLILSVVGYSILPILYLYLSIKSIGDMRRNFFIVSAGFFVFAIWSLLQPDNLEGYFGISELMDSLIELTYILGPIGVISSIILIFISFRKSD